MAEPNLLIEQLDDAVADVVDVADEDEDDEPAAREGGAVAYDLGDGQDGA
jgi:hypothetical protein